MPWTRLPRGEPQLCPPRLAAACMPQGKPLHKACLSRSLLPLPQLRYPQQSPAEPAAHGGWGKTAIRAHWCSQWSHHQVIMSLMCCLWTSAMFMQA